MEYNLTLEDHPRYLHARVSGDNTAANAERFLREAYEACVAKGYTALLVEMNLSGTALEMSEIFAVISRRSATGKLLRKIAYVDGTYREQEKPKFAETVARNRGVNVRLFNDLESAHKWMAGA